ncbi:MAG TPA: hypothetical protein VFC90_09030 [Planctomycetota bacterium]|nr:hypothetical protein [Planctomycetota bacterium]
MTAILLALALVQDPVGEEIRALLRRLESSTGTPTETAETLLRLNQAVEQIAPSAARNILGEAFRGERMPAARRLDLAETMYGLEDRESWNDEAGRIALDASESAETRMRAALLLARAGAPGAAEVGRTLDERLFAEGTEGAARALGSHVREGTSRDLQRLEIDFLFRLSIPGARAVLRDLLADDAVDPSLRIEIAERLHAAGGLDRVRDARAALERVRGLDATLADRVARLLDALKGIQEDPAFAVTPDTLPAAGKKPRTRERERDSSSRVNLIVAAGTAGLLALLLGRKRRG